jgi:hypothetical protein
MAPTMARSDVPTAEEGKVAHLNALERTHGTQRTCLGPRARGPAEVPPLPGAKRRRRCHWVLILYVPAWLERLSSTRSCCHPAATKIKA